MPRKLPPFAAIRAFEAAARHMSFKAAADELCLTPSAISHQVKALEHFLGTGLFHRNGGRLELTNTGAAYLGKLSGLLDGLEASTREAAGGRVPGLRVLATPGFAARWLVPRLNRAPDWRNLRLRVSEGAPSTDFSTNDADIVIHWADDPVPGVVVEPLMASGRYPVLSPEMKSRERIERPEDLLRVPLIHDEVMDGWAAWFEAAGIEGVSLPRGPQFPHCELGATAAERGQGVQLAYDAMIRGTLASGTLVRAFETETPIITIYSVAYPEARRDDRRIRAFRDWIFAEMAADRVLPGTPPLVAE